MATSSERSRATRARKKKGRIIVSIEVDKADLRAIAVAGYPEAVSTDRVAQSKAHHPVRVRCRQRVTGGCNAAACAIAAPLHSPCQRRCIGGPGAETGRGDPGLGHLDPRLTVEASQHELP